MSSISYGTSLSSDPSVSPSISPSSSSDSISSSSSSSSSSNSSDIFSNLPPIETITEEIFKQFITPFMERFKSYLDNERKDTDSPRLAELYSIIPLLSNPRQLSPQQIDAVRSVVKEICTPTESAKILTVIDKIKSIFTPDSIVITL